MAIYFYKGKQTNKRAIDGFVAAEYDEQVTEYLYSQAIDDYKYYRIASLGGLEYKLFQPQKMKKLKKKDLTYFFTQLSFLLKSGINTYNAIDVLTVSTNRRIAIFSRVIKNLLEQGILFSEALRETKLIAKDIVEKVRSGEESSNMGESLEKIAQKLKEEMELSSNIKSALSYPVFSLVAIFAMAMFMLIVLIPQIGEIIADFGAELPPLTLFLMACSDAVVKYWWLFLIVIAIIVILHIQLYKRNYRYKLVVDKYTYKIPILGSIAKKIHILYLSSTLGQLLSSGKNIPDSIIQAKETVTNSYLEEALEGVEENSIRKGMGLYEAMKDYEVFPAEFLQMIAIGEKTSNMNEVLENIYNQYRYETKDEIKAAVDLMQPISLIMIGAIVAVFVVGMYSAIYCIFGQI